MSQKLSTSRRDVLKLAGGAATLAALGAAAAPVQAAAPMMGVLRPNIYRFKLGAFEVTSILDGHIERPPHPTFGSNQPFEKLAELAKANGVLANKYEHVYINTVVNTGKELVLFDTGNGAGNKVPTIGKLNDLLAVAGYKPEQIDVVAFTHGHPDHINGLLTGGKPSFPNARYVFGEAEFDFWKKGENVRDARKGNLALFQKVALPFGAKATFAKNETEVVPGIRAVSAFGHSPGHLAYHVESNGQRLLVWGDIANHYIFSIQQPEWGVSFDDVADAAIATRKRVFDMVSADKVPVIGYHMPFPGLGYVEKSAAGYRWMPASNQFNV